MKESVPTSLQQAVDSIIDSLDVESRDRIMNATLDELAEYHHGWGTGIRNDFNLWSNINLLTDCGSSRMHADDASAVIMNAVWYQMHGQSIQNARREDYRRFEDVVREQGIEKSYLLFRVSRTGKRNKDQFIYKFLKSYFDIDFKSYKLMAAKLDAENPIDAG